MNINVSVELQANFNLGKYRLLSKSLAGLPTVHSETMKLFLSFSPTLEKTFFFPFLKKFVKGQKLIFHLLVQFSLYDLRIIRPHFNWRNCNFLRFFFVCHPFFIPVIRGDVCIVEELKDAATACNAVLSALGGKLGLYNSLYSKSVDVKLKAMKEVRVKSVVTVRARCTRGLLSQTQT